MPVEKFDLIVLGSGPAGEKGAAKAAYFGKRVAVVEKEPVLGGASANTGTLPSKTLRETALYLSGYRQRELFGVDIRLKDQVSVRDFLARERLCKEQERARVHQNLKRHGVALYKGTGSFIDAHTIAVRAPRCLPVPIQGDVILIATGSFPYRPPGLPFHDPRVHDSDTILTLHEIPPSLAVVGGGVIGCEYACMFAALGVQVTVIEKRPRLLDFLDQEIVEQFGAHLTAAGVRLHLSDSVAGVTTHEETLDVRLESGAQVRAHAMLVSAGRSGNTEALQLDKAGVQTDPRGRLLVNEHYQTNIPHIYAAGDVIGSPALAATSMEQARLAMAHAFDLNYGNLPPPILPYGIYTIPECSMAGETEQSLQQKKIDYVVGRATYAGNARGTIIGDRDGLLKLLFARDTMKLLGVQMIGDLATELIHVGLTALLMDATAELFVRACYNYPTLTEMYKYAAYDALGKAGK
jgi:NAD(P) transhydrogenase